MVYDYTMRRDVLHSMPLGACARFPVGPVLVAALVVSLSPADGHAEARAADRMTTTAGATTLLRPVGQPKGSMTSMVTVDLYGDHATLTHHVVAEQAVDYDVIAPVSQADDGPWPGKLAPGEFPSFIGLAKNGSRLAVTKGLATMPVARLLPTYAGDTGSFVVDSSSAAVQRFRLGSNGNKELWAIWTVPYLGDTYSGIDALDCSCGEPWNFSLRLIGLAVDARQVLPSVLEVQNHTQVAASLRQGSKQIGLPPGSRTVFALGMKAAGQVSYSNELALDPFSIMFATDTWKRGEYPQTRLSLDCRSPQEDEGAEGADRDEAYYQRREKQLKADHAALRWEAHCSLSGKKLPPEKAPTFLRMDGSEEAGARRDWFVRGLARELLGGTAPTGLAAFPLLLRGDVLRRSPQTPTVIKASSTLTSGSDRYQAANLVDGNTATAWCEGEAGNGKGATIELAFEKPVSFSGMGLLPGYTKTDWLYEANAAPTRVRVLLQTRTGKQEFSTALPLPASSELFAEGRDAMVIQAVARDVMMVSLFIDDVRPGKFTTDMCISELFFID